MLVALAASCAAALTGVAAPAAAGVAGKSTDCVVQEVDARGAVHEKLVPEGTKLGAFRCVNGLWQYAWAPFGPDDLVTAPALRVDAKGRVSVDRFDRPEHSSDLTIGELAGITSAITGGRAVFQRAVVAVDDGKKRTPAEVAALLAGKDTTGAKVLRVIDRLDPQSDLPDTVGDTGGEPVVVYLLSEIWDAITGAVEAVIDWVVDGVGGIGDWINNHCIWFPPPPPGSNTIPIVTCQF
ncbi:hypothetical protein [Allocatelliglobosispora scoriae]|nr:hypothetical protein [Allocatelliglobosispora scoriae]